MSEIVVVGQVARDLVVTVDALPPEGGSAQVRRRQELLGGKGANQAVACRQLGEQVHLVGVVGADHAGERVLAQAVDDGIGVSGVVRRANTATALLIDVIGPPGTRRLLEDEPPGTLLTAEDVRAQRQRLRAADAVLIQLQQPSAAVAEALSASGGLTVTDGAPADDEGRRRVLRHAAVVRADATEAAALVGWQPRNASQGLRAARQLLEQGPRVVALATGEHDVVAWAGGHVVLPHLGRHPVDTTGAGDAFVVALTVGLLREEPETAAWWAAAAASRLVAKEGGRPDLDPQRLRAEAQRAREVQGEDG